MKYTEAGTYTLNYTAEDGCGNVTTRTRQITAVNWNELPYTMYTHIGNTHITDKGVMTGTVSTLSALFVENGLDENDFSSLTPTFKAVKDGTLTTVSPNDSIRNLAMQGYTEIRVDVDAVAIIKTILYQDGRFAVNQLLYQRDKDATITEYYDPLDSTHTYVFSARTDRPWDSKASSIKSVDFGDIAPTSIAYWFQNCTNLTEIRWGDFDGKNVTSARAFAADTNITTFRLPEMPILTNIRFMCNNCPNLYTVDMSRVNASGITDTNGAFQACYSLIEVDMTGLSGTVDACANMFSNASGGADMELATILANPNLDFSQATAFNNMFRACVDLIGGNGTAYDSNHIDNLYARIDTSATPGYFTRKV